MKRLWLKQPPHGAFFVYTIDTAIRQYSRNFRKACDVIGVSKDISFHSLRHTFACIRRLQTNGNMPLVRDELGHKSLSTTERYCDIPIKRLEDDFPTYAKMAKNGNVTGDCVTVKPSEMESLVEKQTVSTTLWEQGAVGSNPITPTLNEPVGNDGFFVYTPQQLTLTWIQMQLVAIRYSQEYPFTRCDSDMCDRGIA